MNDLNIKVSQIDGKISEIKENLDKQTRKYWLEKILLPVIIGMIPSLLTLFVALKSIHIHDEIASYQKLEILNNVISDFSADRPEIPIITVSLIRKMSIIDESTIKKIENYAETLTRNKIEAAERRGGEEGSKVIEQIFQILQASNTQSSTRLKESITRKSYHVIVASATTKKNALAFKRFLIDNTDFNKCKVFKASSGYAVSIGEWNYNEALVNAKKFMEMPRFHKDYQNRAYLQIQKNDWIRINQD